MKEIKYMKEIVLVYFVLIMMGCQSKYKKMIDEIDKHNLKGIEKILEQDTEKLEEDEIVSLYNHAIKSYDNDEEGLKVFKLLNRYGLKRRKVYLSTLCEKKYILQRVKYLIKYGEKLEDSWDYCKNNQEVYDHFHLEIESLKKIEDAKEENSIALKKRAKIVKDSPFVS